MSHEYASWNVAVGVAFVVGAAWIRHLAGVLPLLASFTGVLCVVSALDMVRGVTSSRLAWRHTCSWWLGWR
jgi:predicted anti-sigma-YlaC factor YlaD